MNYISDKIWKTVINPEPCKDYLHKDKYYGKITYRQGLYGVEIIIYEGWYNSFEEAQRELRAYGNTINMD